MATSLKLREVLKVCCLCTLAWSGAGFSAESLGDPTRPPFELVPNLNEGEAANRIVAVPAKGLQSVIRSEKHEAAIINGTEVKLGEKVGDAVLVVVNETCVVLQGPEGRKVLHMFPDVKMSKDERACTKRSGMQTIQPKAKPPLKHKATVRAKHKSRSPKPAVSCVPEPNKDGSEK